MALEPVPLKSSWNKGEGYHTDAVVRFAPQKPLTLNRRSSEAKKGFRRNSGVSTPGEPETTQWQPPSSQMLRRIDIEVRESLGTPQKGKT